MNVSMGALPEGFCPETMQELADAMATRLIVTPNSNFTSFAAGSVAPTSNVGPWFKDCETWFIWDDTLAMYVPMTKGGFDNQLYITTSQAFTVPDFTYRLKVSAWGGGGGGGDALGGGGGGGGFGMKIISVIPGETITIVIGAAGVNGAPATSGGTTTITSNITGLQLTVTGGTGGPTAGSGTQSTGGIATGGDLSMQGGSGAGAFDGAKDGGDAGGWGGKGGAVGNLTPERAGLVPGGGGGGGRAGATTTTGGLGAAGATFLEW